MCVRRMKTARVLLAAQLIALALRKDVRLIPVDCRWSSVGQITTNYRGWKGLLIDGLPVLLPLPCDQCCAI